MTRVSCSLLLVATLSLAVSASPSQADPVTLSPGAQTLVTTGEEVGLWFVGSDAAFESVLLLRAPRFRGPFFPNHDTATGDTADLGFFEAGAELVFGLNVRTTEDTFFTGAPSRNADNQIHARMSAWSGTPSIPPRGVRVDFEDLFGGGDLDFNDYSFVVTGAKLVESAPVPEPTALVLSASGAAMLLARRRRWRGRSLAPH